MDKRQRIYLALIEAPGSESRLLGGKQIQPWIIKTPCSEAATQILCYNAQWLLRRRLVDARALIYPTKRLNLAVITRLGMRSKA